MKEELTTPSMYRTSDHCVDCGKAVAPHQADLSLRRTQLSRAFGDSRNRDGFILCGKHLDREVRDSRAASNGRTQVSL